MKIENYKKFKYFYFNRDCKLNLNAINKKKIFQELILLF